jgi:hypothetical protein
MLPPGMEPASWEKATAHGEVIWILVNSSPDWQLSLRQASQTEVTVVARASWQHSCLWKTIAFVFHGSKDIMLCSFPGERGTSIYLHHRRETVPKSTSMNHLVTYGGGGGGRGRADKSHIPELHSSAGLRVPSP